MSGGIFGACGGITGGCGGILKPKGNSNFYLIKDGLKTVNAGTLSLRRIGLDSVPASANVPREINELADKVQIRATTSAGSISLVRLLFGTSPIDLTDYAYLKVNVNQFILAQYSTFGRHIYMDITSNLPTDGTVNSSTNPTVVSRTEITTTGEISIPIDSLSGNHYILPNLWVHYATPATSYYTTLGIADLYLTKT